MKGFKNIKGDAISNVIDYSMNIVKSDPNIRIYIGTDSQNWRDQTVFATVIAYRNSFGRGTHFIYKREFSRPKVKDVIARLFVEANKTMDVVQFLSDNSILKIEAIEFDVNKNPNSKSNTTVSAVTGWGLGLGFNVLTKPDELVACKAANEMCR